jgi:hypothetical protein
MPDSFEPPAAAPVPSRGSIQNVAVYCGSSDRVDAVYLDLAEATGHALVEAEIDLVYGGGSSGMMGRVARAVTQGGRRVVGVIPHALASVEIAYTQADELIRVSTMRERKQIMDDRCDAFLVLPGGFGTLEEVAEVITHRYLRYHVKPIVLLNHDGFYDPMLSLFSHFIDAHFAADTYLSHFVVTESVDEAIAALKRTSASAVA